MSSATTPSTAASSCTAPATRLSPGTSLRVPGSALPGTTGVADKLHLSHVTNATVTANRLDVTAVSGLSNAAIMVDDSSTVFVSANDIILMANRTSDFGIEVANLDQFQNVANTQVDVLNNIVNANAAGTGFFLGQSSGQPWHRGCRATTSTTTRSVSC